MTEPPRTLQHRLRNLTCDGYDGPHWRAQKDQAMHEAAAALDAQTQLLAEAREALQGLHDDCVEYVRINNLHNDDGKPASNHAMRQAAAVLAKLKATSGEG